MARIPTPALRGQEVGSVQSQFTPTPFQNLNPDADVFGAGQARAMKQASAGLDALSTGITKEVAADDSTELAKFETEVKTYQLGEDARINSLVGQKQQDAAAAAPTAFKTFLAGARSKYKFQLPGSVSAADNFSALSASRVSANAITAFASGKSVVDKQITVARIATAALNLTANPTQVAAYTDVVRSTVLDPNIGQAQASGLDPALINYSGADPKKLAQKGLLENLIAEQEATGLSQTVDAFVARGDYAGAMAFLDSNPALGVNTPGRTATEAKVATFRQKVQGQQDFSLLLRDLSAGGTPPSLADVQAAAAAEPDINKRARLLSEYAIHASTKNAATNETVRQQGANVVAGLLKGTPGIELIKQNPEFMARNPQALLSLTTGAQTRAVASARALSAEDAAFTGNGGGSTNLPGLSNVLNLMFQSDPAEAAKLISGGGLKKYFDRTTYEGLQGQAKAVEEIASKRESKNTTNPRTIMRNYLSYTKSQVDAVMQKAGPRLLAAVSAVERAAIAGGRPVNAEDVRKVVFENLVKIRTADNFDFGTGFLDKYTVMGAVTQAQLDEGFDPNQALMGEGAGNDRTLAYLLGRGIDEIKLGRAALESAGKTYNIDNLAKHFGVATPQDARIAAENEQAVADMSVDAGYPPAFVEWVVESGGSKFDIASAGRMIKDLKKGSVRGFTTKTLLQAWATK